jgi:hypothetical protein
MNQVKANSSTRALEAILELSVVVHLELVLMMEQVQQRFPA